MSVSTETAWPLGVITVIRPDVAPTELMDETGIAKVVPLLEVTVTSLFRQNFTVIGDVVKPAPDIVKVPPAASEIVVAERPVIVGAWLGS